LLAAVPLLMLGAAPAEGRDWSVIKDSGSIVAATEGGFYPMNYFEGPRLTGFEVELAEALAKKLALKLEWRVVPFDAQLASIVQDRFDFAIASHGYTEERAKSVGFANPHYCTGGQVAAIKGGPLTVAALSGKTVGVQLATTYFDSARKIPGSRRSRPTRRTAMHSRPSRRAKSTPGYPTSGSSNRRLKRMPVPAWWRVNNSSSSACR